MSGLAREWRDFVVFPKDPYRVRSRESRFDLSGVNEGGFLITKDFILKLGNDEFEALRVDDEGNVEIWTKNFAWIVQRIHKMEKPSCVCRHPTLGKPNGLLSEWRDFVVFPKDPDRVRTRAARFDLTTSADGGYVITKSAVVRGADEFEAMRVDDLGRVEIWTKNRVWVLQGRHGIEKPIVVHRNPHDNRRLRSVHG